MFGMRGAAGFDRGNNPPLLAELVIRKLERLRKKDRGNGQHVDGPSTPPPYSAYSLAEDLDDLPVYVEPEGSRVEQEYSMSNASHGLSLLTLKVMSYGGGAASRPLFFDGAVITGHVEMVSTASQAVDSVTITLEGRTEHPKYASMLQLSNFLEIPLVLWHAEVPGQTLQPGTCSWPFSFEMPRTVPIQRGAKTVIAHLPPTYTARGLIGRIDYLLRVVVHRGSMQDDDILMRDFGYLPRTRPRQWSSLRLLSYIERLNLVGPEGDPDGWRSVSCKVKGRLFGKLAVEVECTLSLACPLVYARATTIPLLVTFQTQATQALDLFAQPSAITLRLHRTVTVGAQSAGMNLSPGRFYPRRGNDDPERRRLHGEIPVPRDLTPHFEFGPLALSYAVHLTVDAVGFIPVLAGHAFELSQEIGIATDRSRSPRQPIFPSS